MASRPAAAAAATLAAESSTNTHALERPADALPQHREDRRVGLRDALGAGHHDVVEQGQEVEPVERLREQVGRPVGQRGQRDPGRVQVAKQRHVVVDGTDQALAKCAR